MRKIVKVTALSIMLVLLLLCFTGCPKNEITVHSSTYDLEEKILNSTKNDVVEKANLYYDNTMSMYGFICERTNKSSCFVNVCQNLLDVIKYYKTFSLNVAKADSANVLSWQPLNFADFYNNFKDDSFYTPFSQDFYDSNGKVVGPLYSLFRDSGSTVDFDELNIFITDLAEQELNNKQLAEAINRIVLDKEDHSVVLYCINSMFSGYAAVPVSGITDGGRVEMFEDKNFSGERPFYCLIVGPTGEVVSICDTLEDSLDSLGIKEGDGYNSIRVLSKRGLKYSPITNAEFLVFDDMYVADEDGDNDYDGYPSITFKNTNINYNVYALQNYDQLFTDVNRDLPGLCYVYEENGSTQDGRAAINFMIPLSDLADGTLAEHVTYSFNSNNIKVYGYKQKEETTTDQYGDEETIKIWSWEEIDTHKMFGGSSPYMQEPVCELMEKGSTLLRVNDYATNQDLKDEEYPKENLELYTVQNDSGELWVRLFLYNMDELAEEYGCISIVGQVTALRNDTDSKPAWIDEYALPDNAVPSFDNPKDTPEFFQKTAGLDDFYINLVGKMSGLASKEFESQMVKTVTDVVVNVCLDSDMLAK